MAEALDELLTHHAGVVLRRDLQTCGLSNRRISQQVAAQTWRQVGRRVLVHHTARDDLATATFVAALSRPKAP